MLNTVQTELQHHLLDVYEAAGLQEVTDTERISRFFSFKLLTVKMEMNGLIRSEPHLSEDDLFALPVAYEQQQAADQQLLLQGETLSVRAAAAALRRHPVAVHLRQHPRNLGKADPRRCTPEEKKKS